MPEIFPWPRRISDLSYLREILESWLHGRGPCRCDPGVRVYVGDERGAQRNRRYGDRSAARERRCRGIRRGRLVAAVGYLHLKYHYTQQLAIHYLLTGDDRFRESAEEVGRRAASLWTSPGYAGGADFWTERHAGFGLLAYVWAAIVSDNAAADFVALADAAVTAYLAAQETYPTGYADRDARCFAHSAEAHGEGYGYFGCSPWMSAILADGLDAYATLRGGAQAQAARAALVKLARIVAREGRDPTGKPFYWMGVGTAQDEVDDYHEHWGEAAYVVALGWHHGGRGEPSLETAARALVAGLAEHGTAPHIRSFNWQCRSAVATPFYLR